MEIPIIKPNEKGIDDMKMFILTKSEAYYTFSLNNT